MITAKVLKTKDQNYRGFSVEGHALFDNHGKDIVCSAVSILTINTVNSLEQFTDNKFTCDLSEGISVTFDGEPDAYGKLLMDSFCLGLRGISKQYSKFIRLLFEEV